MANEINEYLAGVTPNISKDQLLSGGVTILIIIAIAGLLGWMTVWLIKFLKYNKKIVLFRKVGNKIMPVLRDKAMFERVGTGGDYWCRMRKFKKILPRPQIQTEKNTFWFFEREDGEWINFSLGDFDKQLKNNANISYIDEDMRLQRLGIQKNLIARFQKITFWDKYGGTIVFLGFTVIVTVCLVVLFQKMTNAWTQAQMMAAAVRDMAIEVHNMAARVTSGAVPVSSFIPLIPIYFRRKSKND